LVTDQAFQFDDVKISGNVLETTLSNSNLELRAAGTGQIIFNDNTIIQGNLSVPTLNVNDINVSTSVDLESVETSSDIRFFDNVITTTNSNSNLELRAAGSGSIHLQLLEVTGNTIGTRASVDSSLSDITISPNENLVIDGTSHLLLPKGSTSQRVVAPDVFLEGGNAFGAGSILDGGDAGTIFGASDTIYNSGSSILSTTGNLGDLRFNTDDEVFEGTGSGGTITFGGVYSSNRLTSVTADTTADNIRFVVNGASNPLDSTSLVGTVSEQSFDVHALQVDDILLDTNTITTNVSNSNLDLVPNGTGELSIFDINYKGNTIKNNGNNLIFNPTLPGYVKFAGTGAVAIPLGSTGERPVIDPPLGDTRYNTDLQLVEVFDGTQYVSAAGVAAAITEAEFNDLLLEYTLIFG